MDQPLGGGDGPQKGENPGKDVTKPTRGGKKGSSGKVGKVLTKNTLEVTKGRPAIEKKKENAV